MLKMHKMYKFPGEVGIFFLQTFPGNLYILCIFNISPVLSTFGWKCA